MSLMVIGAGFGRTGTTSLKLALETLGFNPCYHMREVFDNPAHIYHWHDFAFGKSEDWEAVFASYKAAVDWPTSRFWRELAQAYPDAKVILTVRDPEAWYRSAMNTILSGEEPPDPDMSEQDKRFREMVRKIIREDTFDNQFDDKAHALRVFTEHIETVRRTIAPERLLVFQACDGWEPLCRFLGVPIPDAPYPHANSTEEFKEKHESHQQEKAKNSEA